jgi:hypothetical protein
MGCPHFIYSRSIDQGRSFHWTLAITALDGGCSRNTVEHTQRAQRKRRVVVSSASSVADMEADNLTSATTSDVRGCRSERLVMFHLWLIHPPELALLQIEACRIRRRRVQDQVGLVRTVGHLEPMQLRE